MKVKLKCPECSGDMNELCLFSYPAHYEANCSSCTFKLTRDKRKNSYLPVTQTELDNYKEEKCK